jgi:hypothetical protein
MILPPPVGDAYTVFISSVSRKSEYISNLIAWRVRLFSRRHQNCWGYVDLHLQAHLVIMMDSSNHLIKHRPWTRSIWFWSLVKARAFWKVLEPKARVLTWALRYGQSIWVIIVLRSVRCTSRHRKITVRKLHFSNDTHSYFSSLVRSFALHRSHPVSR